MYGKHVGSFTNTLNLTSAKRIRLGSFIIRKFAVEESCKNLDHLFKE